MMKQKLRVQIKQGHESNVKRIKAMMERFKDPQTPPKEREEIRQKLEAVLAEAEAKQQKDSIFIRIAKKFSGTNGTT